MNTALMLKSIYIGVNLGLVVMGLGEWMAYRYGTAINLSIVAAYNLVFLNEEVAD